jgi:hypothetical protein
MNSTPDTENVLNTLKHPIEHVFNVFSVSARE